MKVVIKGKEREIQVVSVTLHHDLDDPEGKKLKMFFCPNCQNPVAQYQGQILRIFPGKSPIPLPVYHKCRNCGEVYSIQAIV